MKALKHLTMLCTAGALGACSTATTPFTPLVSGTATANADGTYQIVEEGTTTFFAVPRTNVSVAALGLEYWDNVGEKGYVFNNADVTAIAVMDPSNDSTHAGLSGTAASSVPTSGTATYTGAFSATYFNSGVPNGARNAHGTLTTNVDFGAGTLTGSGVGNFSTSLAIAGTISGTNFNGAATFSGLNYTGAAGADLSGGFYGTNTLAGIYQNATVTGVIWGDTP